MKKSDLQKIMSLAWQFVKCNGFTLSEGLKMSWANFKLLVKMRSSIIKFHFQKVDGSIREAYGTLRSDLMPEIKGVQRKEDVTTQTYFDTEKQSFRCFKKANLVHA